MGSVSGSAGAAPLSFTFVTPPRLVVGWGAATDGRLAKEAAALGARRPLIVTGRSLRASKALDGILDSLRAAGMAPAVHEGVPPEPDVDALQAAMDAVVAADADLVIAVGGGSALDVGKGAAALAGLGPTAREFHSGKAPVPEKVTRPIIAVPTTAGTGSEATWVGVYTDRESTRKASIRGGSMMPAVALLDAALTVSCPPHVTAASGMDAFVQAVEAYTSVGANPLTDALALEAARLIWHHVERAAREPGDRAAREAMLLGSYMAGAALNTSRLGLVHGLAHPIGALTGAPHGLLCGLLMPAVMRFNRDAATAKYAVLARELSFEPDEHKAFGRLLDDVEETLATLGIPLRLSEIGLRPEHLDRVAAEAMTSGSTKANPRPVTEANARAVTEECL
jgi:alcohol dehydrogenase class IV